MLSALQKGSNGQNYYSPDSKHLNADLSMNDVWSHWHWPTHASVYLGMPLSHVHNFIWLVNCTPTLKQVCSVILLQTIHLQLHEWKLALQFLVDIDCRHCYIGQKLFCFNFELFSIIFISPYTIQANGLSFSSVLITSSLQMFFY